MSKRSIEERVTEIAGEVAAVVGIELVHVEIIGAAKNRTVRIFIDKPEGITHEDCAEMSTKIGEILETEDIIPTDYVLEVSSPGLERGLYKLEDFKKFSGNLAQFKTYHAIDGQKNYVGRIAGVEGDEVIFDDKTKGVVKILHSAIAKANLQVDLEEEFKKCKS